MEFELGQTYSGYKFLDVVGRSRSAVQYRVQNTLAQRVESSADADVRRGRRSRRRRTFPARSAHPRPPLPPAHRHILHRRSDRGADGDDHGTAGFALAGGAPAPGPASLARKRSTSPASCWRPWLAFTSSHSSTGTSLLRTSCSAPAVSANWRISPWPVRSKRRTTRNPAQWSAIRGTFLPSR